MPKRPSAKLQRPATVTTHHHAIKYTIGFVHAGNYRLPSLDGLACPTHWVSRESLSIFGWRRTALDSA